MKRASLALAILATAFLIFITSANNIFAAPMPQGIAINKNTNQCSSFWGGDEYVGYELPSGWTSYNPRYYLEWNLESSLCYTEEGDSWGLCCKQIGIPGPTPNLEKIVTDSQVPGEICHYASGEHILSSDSDRRVCTSVTTETIKLTESCEYEQNSLVFADDRSLCYPKYVARVRVQKTYKNPKGGSVSLITGRSAKQGECPDQPILTEEQKNVSRTAYTPSSIFVQQRSYIVVEDNSYVVNGKYCDLSYGDEACCKQLGYSYVEDIKGLKKVVINNPYHFDNLSDNSTIDVQLTNRLKGKILLQVEENGEAWYVKPEDGKRIYMKDGNAAYAMMRDLGLGISNADLAKIPIGFENRFECTDNDGDGLCDKLEDALGTDKNKADTDGDGFKDGDEVKANYSPLNNGKLIYNLSLANKLKGKILLQVESHGEAWYINPVDNKRYYMPDGPSAYQIMRFLSLGITNANLAKIAKE